MNVGGNSAIRRVTITGRDIADIIVTAEKLPSLASGIPPIDIPVYQYIDLVPARYSVISSALIEFDVPLSIADSPDSDDECQFVHARKQNLDLPAYL